MLVRNGARLSGERIPASWKRLLSGIWPQNTILFPLGNPQVINFGTVDHIRVQWSIAA